jgi:hypothetical protein
MRNVFTECVEAEQAIEVESRNLATLHDTLLPKLLNGELSVAGIECTMATAL